MTRWWRWTLSLLLCGVGAAAIIPSPAALAAPAESVGPGTVVADLGTITPASSPGFSVDGHYFAYLAAAADHCDLRVLDVRSRKALGPAHGRLPCYGRSIYWAAQADTLSWQVEGTDGTVTSYVWDADPGTVSVVAGDAHVTVDDATSERSTISADGRFVAFAGASATHPAPAIDPPHEAWFVYDRSTGVSLPLSTRDRYVQFTQWAPRGHRFVAGTADPATGQTSGTCFGTGTSCGVFSTYEYFEDHWSPDGTAALGFDQVVYDFTDDAFTPFPRGLGFVGDPEFVGNDQVAGTSDTGGFLWDRRTGAVTTISATPEASPDGRYLLFRSGHLDTYRYLDAETGAAAAATYRGSTVYYEPHGYWTRGGSSYLGIGPGGCSSLRQWSPSTNTVSLFGPPGPRTCFEVPSPRATNSYATAFPTFSSASGRFALVTKAVSGATRSDYLVDLRRHVLLGPLEGEAEAFAPAGSDLLAVARTPGGGTSQVLLVDPAPVPDVDDKPRWSAATPATGARIDAAVGERVHVQLGASDLQGTPVNLYFRWRDSAGTPIASAPKGWSCDRRRLAAGATVADCTFAPPHDYTATRFVDVSATNFATGAQSDTRSYRVRVGS